MKVILYLPAKLGIVKETLYLLSTTLDKVKIYDKGVDVQPYSDTLEEFHMAYRYGDDVVYPLNSCEPLKAECQHFLDCIQTGKTPLTDGYEGLSVVQTLEAAQKSLQNGGIKQAVVRD